MLIIVKPSILIYLHILCIDSMNVIRVSALTADQVWDLAASKPDTYILARHGDIPVIVVDFQSLQSTQWLTDQVRS